MDPNEEGSAAERPEVETTPALGDEVARDRVAPEEVAEEVVAQDSAGEPSPTGFVSIRDGLTLSRVELAAAWGEPTRETARRVQYGPSRRVQYNRRGELIQIVALPHERSETEIGAYAWLGVTAEEVEGCRPTTCGLCMFSAGGASAARESRLRYFFAPAGMGIRR